MSPRAETVLLGDTLAFRARGQALLVVHAQEPSDPEWLETIDLVSALQSTHGRASVVTLSLSSTAIPTTRQRTLVSARVDQARVLIALLGGGTTMRLVVKAFSLFYPHTRAFASEQVDAALRFAEVADITLARQDLEELARLYGGTKAAR